MTDRQHPATCLPFLKLALKDGTRSTKKRKKQLSTPNWNFIKIVSMMSALIISFTLHPPWRLSSSTMGMASTVSICSTAFCQIAVLTSLPGAPANDWCNATHQEQMLRKCDASLDTDFCEVDSEHPPKKLGQIMWSLC